MSASLETYVMIFFCEILILLQDLFNKNGIFLSSSKLFGNFFCLEENDNLLYTRYNNSHDNQPFYNTIIVWKS